MNVTNEGINYYGLRSHIHRRFSIWLLNLSSRRLQSQSLTGANQEMMFYLELGTDGSSEHLLFKRLVKGKSNPDHMRPRGRTGAGASELMDMSGMWSAHLRVRPTKPLVTHRVKSRHDWQGQVQGDPWRLWSRPVDGDLSIRAEYMRSEFGGSG